MTRSGIRAGSVIGGIVLALALLGSLVAPIVAPHAPDDRFDRMLNQPPTVVRVVGADGRLRSPYINPWIRVNQLEQRYEPDRSSEVSLLWFAEGHLVQSSDEVRAPLLLLGADSFGRDVFSRLMFGARVSLGLSITAALLAMCLGAAIGGVAGYVGGATDAVLMRMTEFVIVLPAMYVVLVLRSVMPLVLTSRDVYLILLVIFVILGAPAIARGVRTVVQTERHLDYATAASALGASHTRVLVRHLLPSTRGFLIVQLTLLIPAFIIAEATLSYVGLGFPDPVPSWGTMLHEASNLRALADFPWLLSPAAAMFLVVFSVNLLLQRESRGALNSAPFRSIRS
jgi:peptide/nickel transport system permease protein